MSRVTQVAIGLLMLGVCGNSAAQDLVLGDWLREPSSLPDVRTDWSRLLLRGQNSRL